MKLFISTLLTIITLFPHYSNCQTFPPVPVSLYSISESNPPSTICHPVSVTITGEMWEFFIHVSNNVAINGSNITVNILYADGIVPALATPFSHAIDLGNMTAGTYTLTATTFLDGSPQDTLVYMLNVGTNPLVASFTYPPSICLGEEIQLINTSSGGVSNLWYENGVPASNTVNHSVTPANAGSITIRLRILDGNCQHAMQVDIPIHEPPTIDSSTVSDTLLCLGETVDFMSNSTNAVGYTWSENGSPIDTTQNLSVTPASAGFYNYQLTVESLEGCQDSINYSVDVYNLPLVDIGPDTNDCLGSIELDAGAGFVDYTWQDQSTNQFLIPTTTGNYAVTVTDTNGCVGSDEMYFESCVNVDNFDVLLTSIYPNPVQSDLTIQLGRYLGSVELCLTDHKGKTISSWTIPAIESFDIDLTHLRSGIYYLHVKMNTSTQVFKVLKD